MRPIALIPAAALMGLIWATQLPVTLGAHPWWSARTVLIGAPIGLILAWLAALSLPTLPRVLIGAPIGLILAWLAALHLPTLPRVVIFASATALAGAAAVFGKRAFVASFGDNAMAGQFWFFGWIGIMAGVAALALTLAAIAIGRG